MAKRGPKPASDMGALNSVAIAVADHYQVSLADLLSPCRKANLARARHMGMWLAHQLNFGSSIGIAHAFGRQDHTTVLHGIKAARDRINKYPAYKRDAIVLMQAFTQARAA